MASITRKNQLVSRLKTHKSRIISMGVLRLGIFGSFTREEQTEDSDVDCLVEFVKDKKNFKNFMALNDYLEELVQRRVELVTIDALSPYIGPHILSETEYVI